MRYFKDCYGLFCTRNDGVSRIDDPEDIKRKKFLSKFEEHEKSIGMFLYKKSENFPEAINTYRETINFLENLMIYYGYDERSINEYIRKNKSLLVYSADELRTRLAIFSSVGIDPSIILVNPRYFYNFTNNMLNDTILFMKLENLDITLNLLQYFIENEKVVLLLRDLLKDYNHEHSLERYINENRILLSLSDQIIKNRLMLFMSNGIHGADVLANSEFLYKYDDLTLTNLLQYFSENNIEISLSNIKSAFDNKNLFPDVFGSQIKRSSKK